MSIKFAVVREDPVIEETVINKLNKKDILMVGSGGCTALSLKCKFKDINITLFDTNPSQLELIKTKINFLKNFSISDYSFFNIGVDRRDALNGCGEFESLFRSFRYFIYEFILDEERIEQIFKQKQTDNFLDLLTTNKYWSVAFDLYFSNSILLTMFGKDAIQHAKPNSYPSYFKQVIENGLKKVDFQTNYFLQHIFLGYYTDAKYSCPYYISHNSIENDFIYINDILLNINIRNYDLISLSNVFDWMSEENVDEYLKYISLNAKKGTTVIYRQLNNYKEYNYFKYGFVSDNELEDKLILKDKSLFYNKINIISI